MVTHDDEVATSAERIVHMKDGRIYDGGPEPVATDTGVFGVLPEDAAP